jgi:hypothetical protein
MSANVRYLNTARQNKAGQMYSWAPPSGALINAILHYADIQTNVGGGRTLLRLSAERADDPVLRAALGREARRLNDVSILWDDREDEIFRVFDARSDNAGPVRVPEDASDFDTEPAFEITEAGLAYLGENT